MIDKGIPIRNVYHMVCYAWGVARWGKEADLEWESMGTLDDLLCSLLSAGVDHLRRTGFHKEYRSEAGELSTVRGKLDVLRSSRPEMRLRKRVLCEYDEYDADNQFNRILLATLRSMHRCTRDGKMRKRLSRQLPYFAGVSEMRISPESFSSLCYDRNNASYRLLIDACELYWSDKMANESSGEHRFVRLSEDTRMEKVFEKFLLNFYIRNRPDLKTNADSFVWRLSRDAEYPDLLERLNTDIVIRDQSRRKMLIIDAKYYAKAAETRYGVAKIRNSHVEQVYAYMRNHPDAEEYEVQGMLIYPRAGRDVHCTFPLEGGDVAVHTIDLGKDWVEIEWELLSYLSLVGFELGSISPNICRGLP